jgi:restriction system protein
MAINEVPGFQEFMKPLLETLNLNEKPIAKNDLRIAVRQKLDLSDEAMKIRVPSNVQTRFENRISWALSYLGRAGFIFSEKKGFYQISDLGKKHVNDRKINLKSLAPFLPIKTTDLLDLTDGKEDKEEDETPDEIISRNFRIIKEDVCGLLLDKIMGKDPTFFEKLVLDLMKALGYGADIQDAFELTGQTNDYGIDGVVTQDVLGFDKIYIQAKRYSKDNTISRQTLQQFVGALEGKKATKGVFITTSDFKDTAIKFVKNDIASKSIILINGKKLAELMYEYGVGVSIQNSYVTKKIDSDYFED